MIHQYADDKMHPLYQWCLKQLQSRVPFGIAYECVSENPFPQWEHIENKRLRSDPMRFEWMALPGEHWYFDADTCVKQWPNNMPQDKPSILLLPSGAFESGVMYFPDGCQWFAKEVLARYKKASYKGDGWHYRILSEMKRDICPIEHEKFFVMLGLNSILHSRSNQISNRYFSVVRDNSGQFVFKSVTGIL